MLGLSYAHLCERAGARPNPIIENAIGKEGRTLDLGNTPLGPDDRVLLCKAIAADTYTEVRLLRRLAAADLRNVGSMF